MTGEVPQWYRVVKAAQYLGVPPWDLAEQPVYWLEVAEESRRADAHADKVQSKNRKH